VIPIAVFKVILLLVCAVADSRIKGILKLYADFSIIDNEHKFKRHVGAYLFFSRIVFIYLFNVNSSG